MDSRCFDALTRTFAGGPATRRAALRVVAGGALVATMTRLGLTDAQSDQRRKRRPGRSAPNAIRAEGKKAKGKKGKGKAKAKDKKPPEPKPPACASDDDCSGCAICIDGVCDDLLAPLCDENACRRAVCDPATNDWVCQSTCQTPNAVCCKGECLAYPACSAPKTLNLETCECECPGGTWECADGSCGFGQACCEEEKSCFGGICVSKDSCCPKDCLPGMEQNPSTCDCDCPPGAYHGGWFCCPSGYGPTSDWRGFIWCANDSGRVCPIGWIKYGDPDHFYCRDR